MIMYHPSSGDARWWRGAVGWRLSLKGTRHASERAWIRMTTASTPTGRSEEEEQQVPVPSYRRGAMRTEFKRIQGARRSFGCGADLWENED